MSAITTPVAPPGNASGFIGPYIACSYITNHYARILLNNDVIVYNLCKNRPTSVALSKIF